MKALTILQPYAELIACGQKRVENRTWPTPYRGPLLIHAGKSREFYDPDADGLEYPDGPLVFGAVIAVATVAACLPKTAGTASELQQWNLDGGYRELWYHEHSHGPWCWVLARVRRLPVPLECRGYQGLWAPPSWLVARVREATS